MNSWIITVIFIYVFDAAEIKISDMLLTTVNIRW